MATIDIESFKKNMNSDVNDAKTLDDKNKILKQFETMLSEMPSSPERIELIKEMNRISMSINPVISPDRPRITTWGQSIGLNIGDRSSALDEQPKQTEVANVQPEQKVEPAKAETAQGVADSEALNELYRQATGYRNTINSANSLLKDNPDKPTMDTLNAQKSAAQTNLARVESEIRNFLATTKNTELAVKELDKEIAKVGKSVGEILAVNNNRIRDAELNKAIENINGLIKTAKDSKERKAKADAVFGLQSEYGKLKGQYDVANKTHEEEKRRTANTQEGLRNRLSALLRNLIGLQAASPQESETNLLTEVRNYINNTDGKNLDQSIIAELEGKYKGLERIKKQNESRRKIDEFKKMAPQDQLASLLGEKIPRELQGEFSVASIIGNMDFGNNQWFKEYLQRLAEVKPPSYERINKAIEVFRNREQAFSKVDNIEVIPESTKTAIKKELIANPNSDSDVAIAKFVKGYEEATRTGRQKQAEDAATARAESVDKRDTLKKELLKGGLSKADEESKREELATAEEEINKYTTEVLGEGELQRLKGRTEELQKRLEESKQSLGQLEASEPTTKIQHIRSGEKRPLTLEANRRLIAWNKAVALKKKEIAQLELAINQSEKAIEKERGIVSGQTAAEEKMDKEAQDMIVQKRIDDKKREARNQIEVMNNLDEEKKNIFINEIINIPSGFSEEKVDEAISDTLNEANKQSIDKSGMIEVMPGVWEKKTPEQIKAEQVKEEPKSAPAQEQPKPQVVTASMQDLTTAQNAETRLDALAPTIAITQNRLAALPFTGNPAQIQVAIDEVNKIIAESPTNKEAPIKLAQYTKALDEASPLMGALQNAIAERDSLRKIVSDFILKYGRTPLHMTAEEFQSIIQQGVNT